jgi:hypothetical protein
MEIHDREKKSAVIQGEVFGSCMVATFVNYVYDTATWLFKILAG